jgi:hypothetical protein
MSQTKTVPIQVVFDNHTDLYKPPKDTDVFWHTLWKQNVTVFETLLPNYLKTFTITTGNGHLSNSVNILKRTDLFTVPNIPTGLIDRIVSVAHTLLMLKNDPRCDQKYMKERGYTELILVLIYAMPIMALFTPPVSIISHSATIIKPTTWGCVCFVMYYSGHGHFMSALCECLEHQPRGLICHDIQVLLESPTEYMNTLTDLKSLAVPEHLKPYLIDMHRLIFELSLIKARLKTVK